MQEPVALSLDSRRHIYDYVKSHPGSHLRGIARGLGVPLGTALYHLDYLVEEDLIVVRRDGRYKRFFVQNALGRRDKDYIAAFRHAVPRRVVVALAETGTKRTQRELTNALGVSRSTLSFHVGNLVRGGILTCDDVWPENLYGLAEPDIAIRVLDAYGASFEEGEMNHVPIHGPPASSEPAAAEPVPGWS